MDSAQNVEKGTDRTVSIDCRHLLNRAFGNNDLVFLEIETLVPHQLETSKPLKGIVQAGYGLRRPFIEEALHGKT
jgi:hypothetical protein